MSSIRILIADDFEDWRRRTRLLLEVRPELEVICEASDGSEVVQKAEELKPDLIVLDIGLPKMNGIEAARLIRELSPRSKIVFLSQMNSFDMVQAALGTGALGYVSKIDSQRELLQAVDAALLGKQFVSSRFKDYKFTDTSRVETFDGRESDYPHFEELAAVETDSFPSDEENLQTREHTSVEDVALLPVVEESTRHRGRRVGFFVAAAAALAAAIVLSVLYGTYWRPALRGWMQAQQQADQLKKENSALTSNLTQLNESLATQQREIQNLRAQLANSANAESAQRSAEHAGGASERSSSASGQLLAESKSQEKLLAEARDEVARVNELRANDEASLVVQQARIEDLSDKLRVASATLDMERQLVAAGKNMRELMVARQLHVIDIRDTDPYGNPDKAFARVFLTEDKSLTFYAFDLNEESVANGKHNFRVWAVPEANKNSSRSLGFLQMDAEAQGRWVLKVENPELVKHIDSVFVTVEPAAGGKQPSGQKMLYAYLGRS